MRVKKKNGVGKEEETREMYSGEGRENLDNLLHGGMRPRDMYQDLTAMFNHTRMVGMGYHGL